MVLGANAPHFATADELNLSQPSGDLASEAFTLIPGQHEGSVCRFSVLPVPDRNKLCQHEHHRYRLFHPSVPQCGSSRANWFRAEAFNVLNHVNQVGYCGTYGNGSTPAPGFGAPLVGITNQFPARSLQFSVRVAFQERNISARRA